MDEPAPWQVLNRQRIFTSGWINLDLWAVRLPDGTVVTDHPVLDYVRPAVSIVPVGDDGRVLMIDHYRVITGTRGWELPAGRVDPGESVDEAAPRELMEETGQHRRRVVTARQVFHVRVARRLTRVSEPTDRNETMALRWFTAPEIRDLVQANAIRDGLTLTALCWAMVRGVI